MNALEAFAIEMRATKRVTAYLVGPEGSIWVTTVGEYMELPDVPRGSLLAFSPESALRAAARRWERPGMGVGL